MVHSHQNYGKTHYIKIIKVLFTNATIPFVFVNKECMCSKKLYLYPHLDINHFSVSNSQCNFIILLTTMFTYVFIYYFTMLQWRSVSC